MSADIADAVKSAPKVASSALLDAFFIILGVAAVGVLLTFAGKFIPGGWMPEVALIVTVILAFMFKDNIVGRVAMGAAIGAAIAVIVKWAEKFGLKLPISVSALVG